MSVVTVRATGMHGNAQSNGKDQPNKRHQTILHLSLRRLGDTNEAHSIIADTLPPLLASVRTPAEFELIHLRLNSIPEPPTHPQLAKDDWLAAVGVFLLVLLCTFPVVILFLLLGVGKLALRVSNEVAILMHFFTGCALGGYAGRRRRLRGLVMVIVGGALVGACIALGG